MAKEEITIRAESKVHRRAFGPGLDSMSQSLWFTPVREFSYTLALPTLDGAYS
jgi:hypothetical protein